MEGREVKFERAIEYAKLHNIHKCFETSAKSGNNVEEVFSCAGKELFEQSEKEGKKEDEPVDPTPNPNDIGGGGRKLNGGKKKKKNQKGGCC